MSRIISHVHDYSYNPLRDVMDVESGLAVDVTEMLQTGIVHDAGESLDNNGIDDPNNIIGLVRDEFAPISLVNYSYGSPRTTARADNKKKRKNEEKPLFHVIQKV